MSDNTRSKIGLVLAAIAIIVSVLAIIVSIIIPEIRACIGIGNSRTEPVKVEANDKREKEENNNGATLKKPTKTSKSKKDISTDIYKNPSKINIVIKDERGNRDARFENYIKNIVQSLGFEKVEVNGFRSVEITPNTSVKNQVRATIEINITLNNQAITLSPLHGRGDGEKEAVRHALEMNKTTIINEIKSLK